MSSIKKKDLEQAFLNQQVSQRDANGTRYAMNQVRFNNFSNVHLDVPMHKKPLITKEMRAHRSSVRFKSKAEKKVRAITKKSSGEVVIQYTDSDLLDKRIVLGTRDYLKEV